MENMKAVRVHNYGGPEVLRFEDAPRPTPSSGELLIRVHAASVNPIDWKVRAGYMKDYIPLPLPFIPGWDVSGVVAAVGPGVPKFNKCDEIYARPASDRLHRPLPGAWMGQQHADRGNPSDPRRSC